MTPHRHEYTQAVFNGIRSVCEAQGYGLALVSGTMRDYFQGVDRDG